MATDDISTLVAYLRQHLQVPRRPLPEWVPQW